MSQMDLFDLLPQDDEMVAKYKPIKSTDWKWTMAEGYPKEKNGLKVFSCFACGGGSTMGYKLAGCEVIGCCEIDPKMNEVYIKNHNPKHNFLMDIRDFNKIPNEELPEELFNLDILDGSPPCTTFSMAGEREKSWGKKKKFREGQAEQTLDDLSFVFIDTVAKLRPKVVIMENVASIFLGNAIKYVKEIYEKFRKIGYKCTHFIAKGETMGVPQERHRAVFLATKINFQLEDIDFAFNYLPIIFLEVKQGKGKDIGKKPFSLLENVKNGERYLRNAHERLYGKPSWFTHAVCRDNEVLPTISAGHAQMYRYPEMKRLSKEDYRNASTFPSDFNFLGENVEYICGMSVPPIMIKRIVERLIESGIFDYKLKGE